METNHDLGDLRVLVASAERTSSLPLEPSKGTRKRCKGLTRSGTFRLTGANVDAMFGFTIRRTP